MKHFLINLFVVVALAVTPLTGAPTSTPYSVAGLNRYEKAQMQTVLIRTAHGGQGSGVVIKRKNPTGETRFFVWTAAHVVEGFNDVEVIRILRANGEKTGREEVFPAVVIARSAVDDVALLWLKVPVGVFLPVEFEFTLPRVGDPTFHVGNFFGSAFDGSVSAGIVSQVGVRPNVPAHQWFWPLVDQTTALAVPGSSGGGIFSDKGKVLGILVGGSNGTEGISCYVPVRAILKWSATSGTEWALRLNWCPSDEALTPK